MRLTKEDDQTNPLKISENDYGKEYKEHLLRQYILYVEAADKVSSRRALSNTFFLSASTILLSVEGLSVSLLLKATTVFGFAFLIVFAVGSTLFSLTWYLVLRSYDQLNTGKFAVIHKLEQSLPASLYSAEWAILGRGKDPKRYRPHSKLEAKVPLIFVAIYVALLALTAIVYLSQFF